MRIVVQRHHTGCLCGAGHHHAHVLAYFFQVVDDVGIAGIKRHTHACQIGTLRQRVQRDHTIKAVLQHALTFTIPGELHVALVAEHRYPVCATPHGSSGEVVEGSGWVARRIHPQHECAGGVGCTDRRQVEPAAGVHWHCDGATPSERCAHLVRGICHGWKQHGVTVGATKFHVLRGGSDELLGPNACGNLTQRNVDLEPSLHPIVSGFAQWFRTDAGRITALGVGRRQRRYDCRSRRVARRADGEVDYSSVVLGGNLGQRVEAVVRVWRWNERLGGHIRGEAKGWAVIGRQILSDARAKHRRVGLVPEYRPLRVRWTPPHPRDAAKPSHRHVHRAPTTPPPR